MADQPADRDDVSEPDRGGASEREEARDQRERRGEQRRKIIIELIGLARDIFRQ